MKLQQIQTGILNYIENEIIPQSSGATKFLLYTGSVLGVKAIEKLVNKHTEMLKATEVITEEGEIDIDKLYEASKIGMQKSEKVQYMGIIFNEQDIDMVYEYIKKAGGN